MLNLDKELSGKIIGYCMKIHNEVGIGLDESIYRNSLLHEFSKNRIPCEFEKSFNVLYDNVVVGTKRIDLIAADWLLLELKSLPALTGREEKQIINYLRITGLEEGLLINFGATKLEFKRKFRTPPPFDPPSLQ